MTYSQPTSLHEALAQLAQPDLCVVAGGTDLYPAMKPGHQPGAFLDVTAIEGFTSIAPIPVGAMSGGLRIGAAVTWSDVIKADLPPGFDALKQAAREVGSLQIQNSGTLGGNICNASPAADGVPPLLALNAQVELASAERGARLLPLSQFILGVRRTALRPDELVTAIHVPTLPEGMTSGFEKLGSRRYLVISITMTAANILCDAQGRIAEARIAVGACSATAQRLSNLEADLVGQDPAQPEITLAHVSALSPIDDVRGSGAYRLDAARHQIRRAIGKAVQG